ncbi:hypothetical protein I302_103797 [Kwoniella bestiolae CBS 10118]|uniref:Uncharacterized protein n=1 Tax=Kwoniella bestiolae CBS 10118 TaxID=1296100 RepID=A0A1B9G9G5_9TREE|nr:hypothetical protein I302_02500 [Kwoniella bestiolae CBS 10118]OCF27656.1 hypothetical protein I302_02500 [Kwoniella bestiolae CBS 10118]
MTDYLRSYLPAIQSIIPQSSPTPASLPELTSRAPSLPDVNLEDGKPSLVAFVRHCGCPFAEKEINLLSEELKKNEQLRVIIVQHAELGQVEDWFDQIGGAKLFPDPTRYTLIPDPKRELYAKWGIGQLGWMGMINSSVMDNLKQLKEKDNIDLRSTGQGSYRWQNSGGFAIDTHGIVRWRKLAKDSSDICDYCEAAKTIL